MTPLSSASSSRARAMQRRWRRWSYTSSARIHVCSQIPAAWGSARMRVVAPDGARGPSPQHQLWPNLSSPPTTSQISAETREVVQTTAPAKCGEPAAAAASSQGQQPDSC
ncbi:hypothetical protein BDA96_05G017800 [Sorghum bicolor]|uniref:Uncharacterized protein n=1 Tax=Sorghum bicolor TaxID=4558 RepID=A0A921UEA5_SORBI|nr:hypothetical protein BDA96_05G017800 [Sorghum bicolor]